MSSTGPWPDTSTHLSWYFLNILSGLWDMMTWSWVIWGVGRGLQRLASTICYVCKVYGMSDLYDCCCINPILPIMYVTYRDTQDVWHLVCLFLSEAISCIGDKNHWYNKLSLRVDQLLECLFCCRDWHPASNQHAIDVKEKPKARLWLSMRGTTKRGNVLITRNENNFGSDQNMRNQNHEI